MDDDSLQEVPGCALNSDSIHDTSTGKLIEDFTHRGPDHEFSSEFIQQEIRYKDTSDTLSMQWSEQGDIVRNDQSLEHECPTAMADEQNDLDQRVPAEEKNVYFRHEYLSFSIPWYAYRICISGDNDLGFIVPHEWPKLPRFYLYKNNNAFEVQVMFLGQTDYKQYQLERFSRYISEKVFVDMNTGSNATPKFDLQHSHFKLLLCFLTGSGELDYERMASICDRENKRIQNRSELNDREVYIRSDIVKKQLYIIANDASLSQEGTSLRGKLLMVDMKRIEKPDIDYLKRSSQPTNKKQDTQSPKPDHCRIEVLRYAALNRADFELIYKLPSVLARISELYLIEELRNLFASIQGHPPLDVDRMPIVTFGNCISETFSSNQSAASSLDSVTYERLLGDNGQFQLSPGLIFQSITRCTADESTSMDSLATLGDSVLKLDKTLEVYHRCPFNNVEKPTVKKDKEVSNVNLHALSTKKGLIHYLNTTKIILSGKNGNWLPPGYTIDQKLANKYLKTEGDQKAHASMIEAFIGAVFISTGYSSATKFMHWLGLDVIPTDKCMEIQLFCGTKGTSGFNKMKYLMSQDYIKFSFINVEKKINYHFQDKTYLMSAFNHYAYLGSANRTDHKRLSSVGNALLEFLMTLYVFVTKESVTSGHISKVRADLLCNNSKAEIVLANNLQAYIIYKSLKPSYPENTINKALFTAEKSVIQLADIFEALIAAAFFDSGCSLQVAWNVIKSLVQQYADLDYEIEHPCPKPKQFISESDGEIMKEYTDNNGNFFCLVKSKGGSEVKGSGKSERLAQKDAGRKMKR